MTHLATALDVAGLAAITAGVAFIFWPAGLIVGGIGAVLLAFSLERSLAKEAKA